MRRIKYLLLVAVCIMAMAAGSVHADGSEGATLDMWAVDGTTGPYWVGCELYPRPFSYKADPESRLWIAQGSERYSIIAYAFPETGRAHWTAYANPSQTSYFQWSAQPVRRPDAKYFLDIWDITQGEDSAQSLFYGQINGLQRMLVDPGLYRIGVSVQMDPTPEPSSMLALGVGLLGLAGTIRRRR